MNKLLDDLDAVIAEHGCDQSLRVHTLIPGHFSSYACPVCVEAVQAIALKHLPTATDVTVSSRTVAL